MTHPLARGDQRDRASQPKPGVPNNSWNWRAWVTEASAASLRRQRQKQTDRRPVMRLGESAGRRGPARRGDRAPHRQSGHAPLPEEQWRHATCRRHLGRLEALSWLRLAARRSRGCRGFRSAHHRCRVRGDPTAPGRVPSIPRGVAGIERRAERRRSGRGAQQARARRAQPRDARPTAPGVDGILILGEERRPAFDEFVERWRLR